MASAPAKVEKVAAFEGTLSLPTYELTGQNRNPVFRSQYGVAHIYPYTLLDEIASQPSPKVYRTLTLENRYLRVTVIPDLGGRVYSLFDKIANREVFYKNSIVKFSPLAIRGAFFSGGLEFSFPVAHAPTTADPINWDLRENADGSGSISIGGQEHMSGMRWTITLTLYPDRCALSQDVQLNNPTPVPGRYHYWTNASLDADDQTEFIYPLHRARSYEYAGTASWPFARLDLIQNEPGLPGMEGVPMWPASRLLEPVNFRWQKNMLAQVSIFGRDVEWDFFGAWQHSTDQGYAHCANARDVAGMKLWSWGNAEVGVVNQTALTDDGGVYAETQCGAMETQLDFDFLMPGKVRTWREWWLPLRSIGGLTCASTEVGARINVKPDDGSDRVTLTVGVCPVRDLGKAAIRVATPGQVLLDEMVAVNPERPWVTARKIAAKDLADYPLTIRVTDESGQEVLAYTLDRSADPSEADASLGEEKLAPSEEYYRLGQKHENFDNREQALEAYQKSIELDSGNGPAHFRLGLMRFREADLDEAIDHFQSAVKAGILEAQYYLGLAALHQDRLEEASDAFRAVPQGTPVSTAAALGLGSVAMRRMNWQDAAGVYGRGCRMDPDSITAAAYYALALRKLGQNNQVRDEFTAILARDPLNLLALKELASLSSDPKPVKEKLSRMLADDKQYWLDLAVFYFQAGLPEDALAVLDEAAESWSYPMVDYLAGFVLEQLGEPEKAAARYRQGAAGGLDFVFPSRLEEVRALQRVTTLNPEDYKAKYYLGNFLYAHERFAEGMQLWEEALPGLASYDVLYRNLGLAAWQRNQDRPQAIRYFEKALELNPGNQDLILHLDDLFKAEGLAERRDDLLARILSMSERREDVRKRAITIMVDLGHYEEALSQLLSEEYVPLEMDQSFHETFVQALLLRAQAFTSAGRIEDAISDYRKALEFPKNLGVGRPTTLAQAEVYYLLGCAYEKTGRFQDAIGSWLSAASEHHPYGTRLYKYVQASLDKLSRYSELGFGL